jgi:phosphonate transport system substrate-binding protein
MPKKITKQSPKGKFPVRFLQTAITQAKFWFLALVLIAAITGVLFLAIGNGQNQEPLRVNLDEKLSVSPVQQIGGGTEVQANNDVLQVAISSVLSPTKTLEYYQELLAYMEQKIGKQVTLVLKPTYAEVNDLIQGQRAGVAFVCSLAYVKGNDDFGMELLVAPQINGEMVYYSYLIVPAGSNDVRLEDLRGASFAFTDPMSNTGHLAPTYQLSLLGETPASFFSNHIFTYSHDNSVIAVADALIQGAAVDSLVYDHLVTSNPELADKTKVIARWGPYGMPPVVVNPTLDPVLKQRLQDFLLDLHNSAEGKSILNSLGIDKFVIVSDDIYGSIREMKTKLGW